MFKSKRKRRREKKWHEKSQQQKDKERKQWKNASIEARTVIDQNDSFDLYYKAQKIVPDNEFTEFLRVLRAPLPVTFRLSTIHGFWTKILSNLRGDCYGLGNQETLVDVDGTIIPTPSPLTWYPDGLGWMLACSKYQLKRISALKEFRKFLVRENAAGNINRQEAVSMIPPLLLNVQPHHAVLDMCAAPGSKTAQLLDQLHRKGPFYAPTGFVIANDTDSRRAYMLTHQIKRLGSPNFIVITHNGQDLPDLQIQMSALPKVASGDDAGNDRTSLLPTEADLKLQHASLASKESKDQGDGGNCLVPLLFDRILCDVPCSGDGTLRKNGKIWAQWTPWDGTELHSLQLHIAMRGLQLLKVGGTMAYSTCSFNPTENEAVVAQLLRSANGSVELVDTNDMLPGLIRTPGLSTWQVHDSSCRPINRQDVMKMSPKTAFSYRDSLFPPADGEVDGFHLERCLRILPHHQNTGGFFIVLLKKVSELPDDFSHTVLTERHIERQDKWFPNATDDEKKGRSQSKKSRKKQKKTQHCFKFLTEGSCRYGDECRFKHSTRERIDKEKETGPVGQNYTKTGSKDNVDEKKINQKCDAEPPRKKPKTSPNQHCFAFLSKGVCEYSDGCRFDHQTQEEIDRENGANSKTMTSSSNGNTVRNQVSQPSKNELKTTRNKPNLDYDPFTPIGPGFRDLCLSKFGLDTLPESRFWIRSEHGRRIYYVVKSVAGFLSEQINPAMKVVHTGLKAFDSSNTKDKENYRIAQDVAKCLAPGMKKRTLSIPFEDLVLLLKKRSLLVTDFSQVFQASLLNEPEQGSVVCVFDGIDTECICLGPVYVAAWKTSASLSIMINKAEVISLYRQITDDLELTELQDEAKPKGERELEASIQAAEVHAQKDTTTCQNQSETAMDTSI